MHKNHIPKIGIHLIEPDRAKKESLCFYLRHFPGFYESPERDLVKLPHKNFYFYVSWDTPNLKGELIALREKHPRSFTILYNIPINAFIVPLMAYAHSFVSATGGLYELVYAAHMHYQGKIFMSGSVKAQLENPAPPEKRLPTVELCSWSSLEKQIVKLMMSDKAVKEMADLLDKSEPDIHYHIRQIKTKISATTRKEVFEKAVGWNIGTSGS